MTNGQTKLSGGGTSKLFSYMWIVLNFVGRELFGNEYGLRSAAPKKRSATGFLAGVKDQARERRLAKEAAKQAAAHDEDEGK